jgi:hypothetical protein
VGALLVSWLLLIVALVLVRPEGRCCLKRCGCCLI